MTITWKGSPNFDKNRKTIDRIVIHWFGTGTLESADARFQDKKSQVSAHYGISGTRVWQWVKDEHVAYHAGNYAMNQRSLGIEHDATIEKAASELTYKTSAQILANLCRRYEVPVDRQHIIGHKEVKATQCPGTLDIDRLVSMAAAIVAPNTDQAEKDQLRAERDRNWNYFIGLCEVMGAPHVFDVAKAELEKLIKLEDALREKDQAIALKEQELQKMKNEVSSIQLELKKALDANTEAQKGIEDLKQVVSEYERRAEEEEAVMKRLGDRIEELKKVNPIESYSALDLIIIGIKRLLGR